MKNALVACFFVVVAGCAPASHVANNGIDLPGAQTRCDVDDDCVLVSSACDCNNGGVVVAVAIDARDDVSASLDSALCDAVISNDPGCAADGAVCVDGSCRLSFDD